MSNWLRRLFGLLLLLATGACSMETAINAFSSPEDRQFAQDMVSRIRSGDEAWLQEHFDPGLWDQSRERLREARAGYPTAAGRTRLIGYQVATMATPGKGSTRTVDYLLVTEGGGRWTVTGFRTFANGLEPLVTGWRVQPYATRPPELAMFEASERMVPWLWGFGAAALLVLAGIVWAIVRYNSKKRAAFRS